MGKNRVFGGTCTPLLVGFDHPSSCWKMYQQSLFGEPKRYLGALPKSGMMQNGQLYQLDNLEHPTSEKDGFVLPTPTKTQIKSKERTQRAIQLAKKNLPLYTRRIENGKKISGKRTFTIKDVILYKINLPTPTAKGNQTAPSMRHLWKGYLPTPSANEAKNTPSAGSSQWKRKDSLNIEAARLQGYNQETIGKEARLNPHFVQWMMGFPKEWLD